MRLTPSLTVKACLAAVAAALASTITASAQASTGPYVALGDSYAAGSGVPDTYGGICARSTNSYGHLIAAAIASADFQDPACGSAKITHLTTAQYDGPLRVNDPQLNALRPDIKLVTLTVGLNDLDPSDLGLGGVMITCLARAVLPSPTDSPCQDFYTHAHTRDDLATRIDDAAPRLAGGLQEIHRRSPQARVLLVGYPAVFPENQFDCALKQPIRLGDVAYLRDVVKRLNAMLKQQAAAGEATYVDTYTPTIGHDICSADRWIAGIIPELKSLPVHPNAKGLRAMADAALRTLR